MADSEGTGRGARALRAAATGATAGAVLGFLDAVRAGLDRGSVLPPAWSPVVVLLYAAVAAPPAAVAGALLAPPAAAAAAIAGVAALGAGLAANYWWLPSFTDPASLAGDLAVLLGAGLAAVLLRRRFLAAGPPTPRRAGAVAAAALALSIPFALRGGEGDGPAPVAARAGGGRGPDVLLVVIDTLRADAVGFSGSPGAAATPRMDALAREGTVFTACRAPSSWTKPSTASLLTGLPPTEHGALGYESRIPGEATTLAEVLRAAGWRTAAFTDNPFITPEFGFAQGFDAFGGRSPSPLMRGTLLLRAFSLARMRVAGGPCRTFGSHVEIGAPAVMAAAARFLVEGPDDRPRFAYAHLIEPHYPYTPPPPLDGGRPRVDPPWHAGLLPFDPAPGRPAAEIETMRANYRGEVTAADAAIGDALEALRKAGRLERTIVVITSDHGEEFHEHGGWTHGMSLYEEVVRVPLLLRVPGGPGAGRRVEEPVSLLDLPPTILAAAGVASSMRPRGRSLLPLLEGSRLPLEPLFAEIESGPLRARAVFLGREAYIVSVKGGSEIAQLFDLAKDPGQRHDLAGAEGGAATAARMRALLERGFEAQEAAALARERKPFDEETRQALEALGYTGR